MCVFRRPITFFLLVSSNFSAFKNDVLWGTSAYRGIFRMERVDPVLLATYIFLKRAHHRPLLIYTFSSTLYAQGMLSNQFERRQRLKKKKDKYYLSQIGVYGAYWFIRKIMKIPMSTIHIRIPFLGGGANWLASQQNTRAFYDFSSEKSVYLCRAQIMNGPFFYKIDINLNRIFFIDRIREMF